MKKNLIDDDRSRSGRRRRTAALAVLAAVVVIAALAAAVPRIIDRFADDTPAAGDTGTDVSLMADNAGTDADTGKKRRPRTAVAEPVDTTAADPDAGLMTIPDFPDGVTPQDGDSLSADADEPAAAVICTSRFADLQPVADMLNKGEYRYAAMMIGEAEEDGRYSLEAAEYEGEDKSDEEMTDRRDELTLFRACALAGMGHRHDAMRLLNLLRTADGSYSAQAEVLYNMLRDS